MSERPPFNSRARADNSAPQRYPTARTPFAIGQLLNPSESALPDGSARLNEASSDSWLGNRPSNLAPRSGNSRARHFDDMEEEELGLEEWEDLDNVEDSTSQSRYPSMNSQRQLPGPSFNVARHASPELEYVGQRNTISGHRPLSQQQYSTTAHQSQNQNNLRDLRGNAPRFGGADERDEVVMLGGGSDASLRDINPHMRGLPYPGYLFRPRGSSRRPLTPLSASRGHFVPAGTGSAGFPLSFDNNFNVVSRNMSSNMSGNSSSNVPKRKRELSKEREPPALPPAEPEQPQKGLKAVQCVICMEPPKSWTATKCGHVFCYTCLMQALIAKENEANDGYTRAIGACPVCRTPIDRNKKGDVVPLLFMTRKKLTKMNEDGEDGKDAKEGKDSKDGDDGKDGADGPDGPSSKKMAV